MKKGDQLAFLADSLESFSGLLRVTTDPRKLDRAQLMQTVMFFLGQAKRIAGRVESGWDYLAQVSSTFALIHAEEVDEVELSLAKVRQAMRMIEEDRRQMEQEGA